MNKSLTIINEQVKDFIHSDFEIEILADDCLFSEGPVWNESKKNYLFSDITDNCIYSISENESKSIVLANSGTNNRMDPDLKADQVGSNGLAFNSKGHLLLCRHGSHDVAINKNDNAVSHINSFRGKLFNSPNDLVIHSNGTLFFSDPPYGLKNGNLNPSKFQICAGVYAYRQGETKLITDKYKYPNGVCISKDQSLLYVCSSKPFEKYILIFDAETYAYKGVFAQENSDGMKMDDHGNLYLCTKEGIVIINGKGERMAVISLPAIPANACWGGQGKDLLITARNYIFLIKDLMK
jgi:gluconolactonase